MWTLDRQWLGAGTWTSMKACVRQKYFGGGIIATPWNELGSDGCRNVTSTVQPTCLWGFWRIDRCDLTTAASLMFQLQRYLWAQSRMRDLLASKPTAATPWQTAADWTWSAAQLISVLQWSTNVRFDNPNRATPYGDYKTDLVNAGLLPPPPSGANLGFAYDNPTPTGYPAYYIPYQVTPRVLNAFGDTRVVPLSQNDFSPGNGPLGFIDRAAPPQEHPMFAAVTSGGPAPYYSQVPIGMTDQQADEIRAMAFANYTAAGGTADSLRWASTKAFNDWWFRATWSWDTIWRPLGGYYTRTVHIPSGPDGGAATYGWSSSPVTLVLGGARMAVETMASQLRFYTDRAGATNNYLAWMQTAMTTYSVDTAGVPSTTPEGANFNASKARLLQSIGAASSQYAQQSLAAGSAGGDAATYTALSVSLFQTVFSLVAQSVPIIGTLYAVLQQAVSALVAAIGGAVGNTPCPAFPFIRVMSPSSGACTLSTDDIVANILAISSNATWPVQIAGQTRTFQIDGVTFTATFQAVDTTADAVARRINASAALVGLGTVAAVQGGQVHVTGRDPGQGPAKATGGTACVLGLPGPCMSNDATYAPRPSGSALPPSPTPAPTKSSPVPWLIAAAVAARFLLGS